MSTPNWETSAGLLGVYPAQVAMSYQLVATPADSYAIISGTLPTGLTFRNDGLISGTPGIVPESLTSTFVVRATSGTDIQDRTFEITVSGTAVPTFTTTSGPLGEFLNSAWQEIQIEYNNPISTNPVSIRVAQGELPPGLEINEYGLIRGYPEPPVALVHFDASTTIAIGTVATDNYVTVLSTYSMYPGRSIIFTGVAIGNLIANKTYYIKTVVDASNITLSEVPFGDTITQTTASGFMNVSLLAIQIGEPTKRQYSFTLELSSPLGSDLANYSFIVVNYYLPISQGGLADNAYDSITPVIYNTQPPTYAIENSVDYGYYVLPPGSQGQTYLPSESAYIGQFLSDEYFAFRIIGHDFDGDDIVYSFQDLPTGLTGDTSTGWIYGIPVAPAFTIMPYDFTVRVYKQNKPSVVSAVYNFSMKVANDVNGDITWITDSDLGTINNATNCYSFVEATSDVELAYTVISGALPPNLTLTSTGLIQGIVAYQPTDIYEEKDSQVTFTFTVRAYNPDMTSVVYSDRTFTLTVNYYYDIPTDSLYIKCTPGITDRLIIRSLLDDNTLIPTEYVYRPSDPNFGKASDVVYAHAYGIYANDIAAYIEATKKNHYWRNITLGELKTASAKDANGDIIYEVVYSEVIDNLTVYDPNNYDCGSLSVPEQIYWPRFIDLHLGPWYASNTEIYDSYIYAVDTALVSNYTESNLLTQIGQTIITQQGEPSYYTSLTPGYARILYPNSLQNMRSRVEQELGVDYNYRILPLWMTSQQTTGGTLGFTPAWVIAYTKPPVIKTAVADATHEITNEIELDSVANLQIGGKVVFSGNTFGGIIAEDIYYVKTVNTVTNRITVSASYNGSTVTLTNAVGVMAAKLDISYAEIIKNNIENNWNHTLNEIDFQIDRFTVNKQLTYNFDSELDPGAWTRYPTNKSTYPDPDPIDSENFYVLFPQRTILPVQTQYNL